MASTSSWPSHVTASFHNHRLGLSVCGTLPAKFAQLQSQTKWSLWTEIGFAEEDTSFFGFLRLIDQLVWLPMRTPSFWRIVSTLLRILKLVEVEALDGQLQMKYSGCINNNLDIDTASADLCAVTWSSHYVSSVCNKQAIYVRAFILPDLREIRSIGCYCGRNPICLRSLRLCVVK